MDYTIISVMSRVEKSINTYEKLITDSPKYIRL